ncbi:MAG: type II CAAX endopeptidase family protein [Candidatus Thermoplasmatota archaeon]
MKCPRCKLEMEDGRCPACGYTPPQSSSSSDASSWIMNVTIHSLTVVAVSAFLFLLLLNAALTIWSIEIVLPETLLNSDYIYLVLILPIAIFEVSGYSLTAYYIFLLVSLLLSLVAIFYTGIPGLFSYFKEVLGGKFEKLKENERLGSPFLRLVTIFTSLIFITYVYLIALQVVGISPAGSGLDELPLWERIYSLTRAVVWEEIVVRVVFIGVPMAVFAAVKGREGLRGYLLGGFDFKSRLPVILILISSLMFAMAHVPGWDLYKIPTSFAAGLAFGYLFVKDGLHSAIMLHFFWNFMSMPDMLLDIANYEFYFSLLIMFWMVVGVYYTYYYLKKLTTWVREGPKKEKRGVAEEVVEEELVRETAGVTIGYVCPNCAFTKALYTDEGTLKCKRCGTESDPKSEYAQGHTATVSPDREWPPS